MLEATQRAEQFQRERAALSDKLNGTPCAEIRWGQEKEALQADLAAARERIAELEGELQSYKTLADQQLMHLARGNRRIKALDKALTMAMDDVPGWYDMARAARILTQGKAETAE
jgi:chromosome segregation ATPase